MGLLAIHGQEFESGEFNDKVFVRCADPRLASAIIDPRMMETLLELPAMTWGLHDSRLIVVERFETDPIIAAMHPLTPSWIEQAADFAAAVAALIRLFT